MKREAPRWFRIGLLRNAGDTLISRVAGKLSLRDTALTALCRHSYRFYTSVCLTVALETDRGTINIPLIKGIGLSNLSFDHNPLNPTYKENWIRYALAAIYGYRSGIFVDVGANIGKLIVNLLFYDRDVQYIGFDPNINCCFYLRQLIEANQLKNYEIIPVALSDNSTIAQLGISEDFDVRGTIISGFHNSPQQFRKTVVERGDRFLLGQSVAVIKIDAEGSELPVLCGFAETIGACNPILLLEILDYANVGQSTAAIRRTGAIAIARYLADSGYVLYRVTSRPVLQAMSLATLHDNLHPVESNYIAVPAGECDILLERYQRFEHLPGCH